MDDKKTGFRSIDEYIASFPEEIQTILQEIRATIKAAVPDAEEKISYQMPTFFLKGNLVHFAAFKNHIGFYPMPTGLRLLRKKSPDTRAPRARSAFRSTNRCRST